MRIINLSSTNIGSVPKGSKFKDFKNLPLTNNAMKNRETFSRYVYNLHELVNKMLGKNSGLSYCDVRDRYEHFRSRCTVDLKENKESEIKKHIRKTKKKKEKGCTEPLYGKKSKCIIKIVPQETVCDTFQMNKKCETKRHNNNKTLKKDKDN